jgi:hypothetical protein
MTTFHHTTRRRALRCALGLGLAGALAAAVSAGAAGRAPQQQVRRFGPFATMRRANEVADTFRRQGCQAVAFHNGDGYYVDVRC